MDGVIEIQKCALAFITMCEQTAQLYLLWIIENGWNIDSEGDCAALFGQAVELSVPTMGKRKPKRQ